MGKYPGKMTTKRQMIGAWGEQAAADFLSGQGYEILARNVRTPRGEIDLLVRSGEVIIFVEVRTLTSSKFAHPEETINHRKQSHILAAVEDYIQSHDIDHWQIDAIAIEGKPGSGSKPLITHFENVMG
jgi:putative endonuclease